MGHCAGWCNAILKDYPGDCLATSFNEQFDQHGSWRREFALRMKLLAEWLKDHDLLDAGVEERLLRLENQVRSDKVMIAFVAEFSRGKSEMINALFFAGYGRRIMPARAGRTTMCPTEMGYEPDIPPSLRLLPIETRLQPHTLVEWRNMHDQWVSLELDVNNPQQLAKSLEKVGETCKVSPNEARALGFWHNLAPQDNPMVDAQGLVEIPRWRHALINIAHPLLKQGLVILDTPGLNAIGAEPELTVSLIPQAHAVVFMLGADTGVTKSDLSIWREHLITKSNDADARLVILNKIDTLWDALSSPGQIQRQIDEQCASTADILGIPTERVIAVSAQKGLVAKITEDEALLRQSCLPVLEDALSTGMMGKRQKILALSMKAGINALRSETSRVINIRKRDLTEQMLELQSLQGKNVSVIKHMRNRIAQEQAEFDLSGARIHAVRSVHLKLLREVFYVLGSVLLKKEMGLLSVALMQKGLKLGVKNAYGETFDHLQTHMQQARTLCAEIQSMLEASFTQLNAEYGFSLQPPSPPNLDKFAADLETVKANHLQYLGIGNVFKLAQPEFTDRLVRALAARLRSVLDGALSEVEVWSKSAAAQLDAQLRERRRNFVRRIEAIDRISQAAGGLGERITEINHQNGTLDELEAKLLDLTSYLVAAEQSNAPQLTEVDLELF